MKSLVMILAGGTGSRLYPLSKNRCKPAVPFGSKYRVIDFVLSNFTNSGFYKIKVLTQFMSDSLGRHITGGWKLAGQLGHYIDILAPQRHNGDGEDWYHGTADAVYKNRGFIKDEEPDYVFVFGADHVYKMDVRQMLDCHIKKGADLTVASVPVPVRRAKEMGVVETDKNDLIIGFSEKPDNPMPMADNSNMALASMGNYIFNREALLEVLEKDALDEDSGHDFGHNIIPMMIKEGNTYAYDFMTNSWPGMEEKERGYWVDVGSIDAYWESNMDLCSVTPRFNLYNQEWPIRTIMRNYPPAKFVFASEHGGRIGRATDSLVTDGCIISGGYVDRSILSQNVRINSYANVTESVLMAGVEIGRYCNIKRAIIDKGVHVPPYTTIGFNHEEDREHFYVSKSGIVVIPKREKICEKISPRTTVPITIT